MAAARSSTRGVEGLSELSDKQERELKKRLSSQRRRRVSRKHLLSNAKSLKEINPFQCDDVTAVDDVASLIGFGLILVPLRFILILIVVFLSTVGMMLTVVGQDLTKPLPESVLAAQRFIGVLSSRAICACCGIYSIKIKGKRADPEKCKMLVLAPHSTVMDAAVLGAVGGGSGVAKGELESGILGPSMRAGQTLFVHREDKSSRQRVAAAIRERIARHSPWRKQMTIFPEGTCTNRTSLIQFRRGAFEAGAPVQPVCLSWEYTTFDPSWTSGAKHRFLIVLRTLAQLQQKVTVEFLPVYEPSEAEQADAGLFTNNVRNTMAEALGVPTSEFSYSDMFLAKALSKHKLQPAFVLPFTFVSLEAAAAELGSTLEKSELFDLTKALMLRFAKAPKIGEEGRLDQTQFKAIAAKAAKEAGLAAPLTWGDLEDDLREDGTVTFQAFLMAHLRAKFAR